MNPTPEMTPEDLQVFIQEAEEQLQLLDEAIIKLEAQGIDSHLLQEIFRAAHTLKGSSAMLGHQRMSELAHAMESVLDLLRKGTLPVTTPLIDGLLRGLDGLKALKEELVSSQDSGIDIASMVTELEAVAGGQREQSLSEAARPSETPLALDPAAVAKALRAIDSGQGVFTVLVGLSGESILTSVRCFQALTQLAEVGEVLASRPSMEEIEQEKAGFSLELVVATSSDEAVLRSVVESVPEVTGVEVTPYRPTAATPTESMSGGSAPPKQGRVSQTVRIDVDRLDKLMNTIGELITDRTRIVQISRGLESRYQGDDLVRALGSTFAHTSRLISDIQEEIMKARMVPIGTVFSGFPRMVRDLAQKFDKRLEFLMEGQETEIDRTVVEHIRDPLVHLLRNAVDHGVEPPEVRRSANKPEKATLRLAAYHEQGQIVITVTDDGKGIDPAKVKESAVAKGLISAEAAARMSETEARDLIFMPGLSTHEKATEVSGRGVGMDIVKTNIEAIHGFVAVDTVVGQGARFTLRLPLTLAIIQGILARSNGVTYVTPLVYVLETLRVNDEDVHTVGGRAVMSLRGDVLPLINLSSALGTGANGHGDGHPPFAVVVRAGERKVALAVDSLLEPQEIVVKSLGERLGRVQGISGASILGDGQVVLILDIPSLISAAASTQS